MWFDQLNDQLNLMFHKRFVHGKDYNKSSVSWHALKATQTNWTGLGTCSCCKWSSFTVNWQTFDLYLPNQFLCFMYRLFLHVKENTYFYVCVCKHTHAGLCLIETSVCAHALWVDGTGGLGRSPPSSYPSGEWSASKPDLSFTAFNKPSNGTGQRAKDGERKRDT